MRAEYELELQPQGMIAANAVAVIVIVLQTHLRELGRVQGQVRRQAEPLRPERRVERGLVAAHVIGPQPENPADLVAPEDLAIHALVLEGFLGQELGWIVGRLALRSVVAAPERLGLERQERESGAGV